MSTINIRKALLEMDKDTDLQYNLTPLYESIKLSEDKKKELVKYLDNYDIDATNKLLSNEFQAQGLAEDYDDDLTDSEIEDTEFDVELTESDNNVYGVHHYPSDRIIFIGTQPECGIFIEDNGMQEEAEVYKLDMTDPRNPKPLNEGAWDIIKDGVKTSGIGKAVKDTIDATKEETTWQGFKDNMRQRSDQRAADRAQQAQEYKNQRLAQAQQNRQAAQNNNQQTNTQGNQQNGTQNTTNLPKGTIEVKGKPANQFFYKGEKITDAEYQKLPASQKRDAVVIGTDGKYVQRGRDTKWVGKPAKVTQKKLWVAENLNEDFDEDNTFIEGGVEYSWLDKDITSHMSVGPDGFAEEWFLASAVSEDDGETYYFIVDENDFIDWGPCDTEEEAREFLY